MKISVKNLGSIKSGTVNLDERFTVFVGYNNSGKTYMANTIWSFYHHYLKTDLENNNGAFQQFAEALPAKIIDDYFVVPTHHSFKNFNLKITDNEGNNAFYKPYFLPASRIFYPSFYKYIFQVKKNEVDTIEEILRRGEEINKTELSEILHKPYHQSANHLMDDTFMLDPTNPKRVRKEYTDLALELERIVEGQFILKSVAGIGPVQIYKQLKNGEEIPIHLASSSDNQLVTLFLYLKYFSLKNQNLLIIDEPEENLHPKHQAALAKLLVQFANRNNNKVIVTTHSSFFTDCINNYIRLAHLTNEGAELPDDIREEMLSGMEDYSLKGEDFGVYFFDGEQIKQYRTQKYGVYFEDFVKAEVDMKDMRDRLNSIIHQNEAVHV